MNHEIEIILQIYDNDNTWNSEKLILSLKDAIKEYGKDTPATLIIYSKQNTTESTILKGTFKEILKKIYERRNIPQAN